MWNTIGAMVVMLSLHPAGAAADRQAPVSAIRLDASAAATTDTNEDRPFTRLVPYLAHDIGALPSRNTLLLLLAGAAGAAAASNNDESARIWAVAAGSSTLSRFGAIAGDGWVQGSVALGTFVAGRLSNRPGVSHLGSDLVRGQILNGLVTTGLKVAVDRARPNGGSNSFPSGHTSASFTTAAVLQGHYGWKAGGPAFALATVIGWSRVRDRAHWASDIVGGATLGTIVGLAVTKGHREAKWLIAPAPVAGGVAITFVKLR
jgi:membrane-associated phospholipid phosphatase